MSMAGKVGERGAEAGAVERARGARKRARRSGGPTDTPAFPELEIPLSPVPDTPPERAFADAPIAPLYSKDGKKSPRQGARALPYIAGLLAAALLGIGLASYFAANLLGGAVRAAARRGAETPAALAATVCNELIHQDYGDLMSRVDPDPAPPVVTDAFDATATTQRLQTLDHNGGPVTSCSAQPLDSSQVASASGLDGATRLLLVMWRSGTPQPITAVLITRQGPIGAWLIERDSSFLLAT
jgi:hypothetical protein